MSFSVSYPKELISSLWTFASLLFPHRCQFQVLALRYCFSCSQCLNNIWKTTYINKSGDDVETAMKRWLKEQDNTCTAMWRYNLHSLQRLRTKILCIMYSETVYWMPNSQWVTSSSACALWNNLKLPVSHTVYEASLLWRRFHVCCRRSSWLETEPEGLRKSRRVTEEQFRVHRGGFPASGGVQCWHHRVLCPWH
jgi:hypothetical protein